MGRSLWLLPLNVGCALLATPAPAQDGLETIAERELSSLVAVYKGVWQQFATKWTNVFTDSSHHPRE
jgi:hypothetical protein